MHSLHAVPVLDYQARLYEGVAEGVDGEAEGEALFLEGDIGVWFVMCVDHGVGKLVLEPVDERLCLR